MTKSDIIDILEKFKKDFEEYGVESVLRTPEEEPELSEPILTTLHKSMGVVENQPVTCEMLFLPKDEDDKAYTFNILFTLTDNVNEKNLGILMAATSMINFYLPFGSFILNTQGGILVFKQALVLPEDVGIHTAMKMIDTIVGRSLDMVDNQIDYFIRLSDGRMSLEEYGMMLFPEDQK